MDVGGGDEFKEETVGDIRNQIGNHFNPYAANAQHKNNQLHNQINAHIQGTWQQFTVQMMNNGGSPPQLLVPDNGFGGDE